MAELANCSRCGAVFVKGIQSICPDCYREEQEAFDKVYEFLREQKNREATMKEISKATLVSEELITKFIKDGRLTAKQFPNLSYPCDRCGEGIKSGKICSNCQEELQQDLELFEGEKRTKAERLKREKEKQKIYYTIDQHKK